eukprot:COSAG01_NODE_15803_length_1298_cov_1.273561_1_plen_86_part_10
MRHVVPPSPDGQPPLRARIPNGGRSFEYLAGEDPFLGYTLIQPVVKGIQSQGVIANVKHYALNNQEGDPNGVLPPDLESKDDNIPA